MTAEAASQRRQDTVLIVDDEHKSLKYFSRLFNADFEVLTCSSAEEAEQIFEQRNGQISVIVSDHRMPTTTGVALLTRIKERWPDTVRLLTTAYADPDSLAASINEARVHRFVSKPWDLEELRCALEEASSSYARAKGLGGDIGSSDLPPLVGVVAHELATPLLSIEMTSKSIITSAQDQPGHECDETLQRFVQAAQRIGEDAARARRLVRSLADLARNTARASSFTRVSMKSCIDRAVTSFPYQPLERGRIALEPAGNFEFVGSEDLMIAVITNLLSNALDAIRTVPGAGITIRTAPGARHNSVVMHDTGPGVPATIAGEAFHPFVSGKSNGTGLGLAICDWIVRSFGGTITLTTQQGTSTTVEIQLPHPMPQATG